MSTAADVGPRPARRRWSARALPYLILAPALVAELAVHIVPMLVGVFMSTLRLNQFSIRDWVNAPFVGLDNYVSVATLDSSVAAGLLRSFGVTVLFSVLAVLGEFLLGLAAAVALHRPFRGRAVLRTLFLVPFALPMFSSVITWMFMLQRDTGLVNTVLVDWLGLTDERPFWLVGQNSFVSLVVVAVWRTWPFAFLTITAGLQSIPTELYEAANVDGAGPWRRLFSITLPMLRPVNTVLLLVLFLWSFNDFNTPYLLFGQAAPAEAGLISLHIYQSSFVTWNFGLGSAMSVLMLLFLLVVTVGYLAVVNRRRDNG
ncbi:carbohydrate ABC transporter permease [Goodfellowiella coeruleoviolacea]|uniref:Multiple sugar transport system permease protein n=1 Tax=Goodfellowiella coeruleoviolacea TaxID=334858 RepID=A0AAE3GL03_9PSEU|nr:sugar ABC transporter permease [Goodfellowiella coeruleoviolacea]MCP2169422.1 multiple sugar transport system permease protein [Goodfellowiella coeruleoviolacea]